MNSSKSPSTDNSEGHDSETLIVLFNDCLCDHYRQSRPITTDDVEHSALWKRQCQQD